MRPVQLADLDMAARVLVLVETGDRSRLAAEMCTKAHVADKYRKRIGRPHPEFGVGSLMAAAASYDKCSRPDACTIAYLECLQVVIGQIAANWQNHTA
jgi:hypothetical protein